MTQREVSMNKYLHGTRVLILEDSWILTIVNQSYVIRLYLSAL